jgi:hypothetical protein
VRRPLVLAGIFAALAVVYFFATGVPEPPDPPAAALLAPGGCTLQTYANAGSKHLDGDVAPSAYTVRFRPLRDGEENPDGRTVVYSSFPPTTGPHYPKWVLWGRYDRPLPAVATVHNLEHGGVAIQYGRSVPEATIAQLRRFYAGSPNGMLLAPLPALGRRIALTAWRSRALCTRFHEGAYTAFRDTYRYKGPERFSADDLAPGR